MGRCGRDVGTGISLRAAGCFAGRPPRSCHWLKQMRLEKVKTRNWVTCGIFLMHRGRPRCWRRAEEGGVLASAGFRLCLLAAVKHSLKTSARRGPEPHPQCSAPGK